ncbi:hypothetical protein [Schlesneria paludicola]|uniref:hypothetical protein n=1 Tax=Schlesneria paludicola TaxID=360056 RepID=UPI00029A1D68|nr:hypothetical protein [Schlesneria paludicola]
MDNVQAVGSEAEFSLVRGGPFYQCLLSMGLVRSPLGWLHRRIAACVAVTWLPLALLTTLAGTFSGGVDVPFLTDLANARFLLAVPMLLGAELVVHKRIRDLIEQFTKRELIGPADRPGFESLIAWTMRLRNSAVAELILVVIAYTGGTAAWQFYGTLPGTSWYATPMDGKLTLTLAGHWLAWISLPLARFIILRWYYRLFLWYLFLWRVSRVRLNLDPLHPDRAGGLGFLDESATAFGPALMAQSVFFSAMIGNQIWHLGAKLPDFQLEILGFVLAMLMVVLFPLMFFTNQMIEVKFEASHVYGELASRYVSAFRKRWLTGAAPEGQELLGAADIQSLADLGNSYQVVNEMRVVPVDKAVILKLAIEISIPLLPLLLTMVPLSELLTKLLQLLM